MKSMKVLIPADKQEKVTQVIEVVTKSLDNEHAAKAPSTAASSSAGASDVSGKRVKTGRAEQAARILFAPKAKK